MCQGFVLAGGLFFNWPWERQYCRIFACYLLSWTCWPPYSQAVRGLTMFVISVHAVVWPRCYSLSVVQLHVTHTLINPNPEKNYHFETHDAVLCTNKPETSTTSWHTRDSSNTGIKSDEEKYSRQVETIALVFVLFNSCLNGWIVCFGNCRVCFQWRLECSNKFWTMSIFRGWHHSRDLHIVVFPVDSILWICPWWIMS